MRKCNHKTKFRMTQIRQQLIKMRGSSFAHHQPPTFATLIAYQEHRGRPSFQVFSITSSDGYGLTLKCNYNEEIIYILHHH